MNIFGLFQASQQPEPQVADDDNWLSEFINVDELEDVEFDDDYFAQDDEYISLVNSRDEDEDDDFNFDDFNLDNLEPEEEDYSGLDDFFSDMESDD